MIKERKNIHIVHRCEDQFNIRCTLIHEFDKMASGWRDGRWSQWKVGTEEVEEEGAYGSYYYPSLVTLYVDLLTFCNKTYGMSYEVTDKMRAEADSYRGKKQCLYNIAYEVGWKFNGSGYVDIVHQYRYDDISSVCQSTMGDWRKEEVIALADELVRFFKEENPFGIVVDALTKTYKEYDAFHVGYKRDTRYVAGDVDNNVDSNVKLTMLT